MSRTAVALLLTLAAVAIPAGAWYVLGSADVDRTIARIEKEPETLAQLTAQRLARRIGWRLEELRASESGRPYFQYQALMHDPRGVSEGIALSPSPLSEGAGDPLVDLWFQISPDGRVTSPQFDETTVGADPHALVAQTTDSHEPPSRSASRRALVALRDDATSVAALQVTDPRDEAALAVEEPAASSLPPQVAQSSVQKLDSGAYYQNAISAQLAADLKSPANASARERLEAGRTKAGASVSVVVGKLTWKQISISGSATLAAVRRVVTPAGPITQGFLIAGDRIESSYSGATLPARIRPGARSGPTEARLPLEGVAWHVAVDPSPLAPFIGERGEALRRRFVANFLTATSLALLVGMLVVLQVRRAERTAAERSRFAASAAHELRTPLASLRLHAEMLADELGDPARGREYARAIAEEAERLGRVVTNVLGFSRLERGALTVRRTPGDLGAAVRETLARLQGGLESKGARIAATIEPGLPTVAFDGDAVDQILRNLVDNAEKFASTAADRTVHVSLRAGEGCVVLGVRDHGPGVSADQRKSLFRPFSRTDDRDAPPGLGLGLALVHALAAEHGGEARYLPHPDGGADFQVRFPALTT